MFFLHQLNFETVKEGEQYIPFLLGWPYALSP